MWRVRLGLFLCLTGCSDAVLTGAGPRDASAFEASGGDGGRDAADGGSADGPRDADAPPDTGVRPDLGSPDTGASDTGVRPDVGVADTGAPDLGAADAGRADTGALADAGPLDTGAPGDSGPVDTGPPPDAGPPDAAPTDAGPLDTGATDAGPLDTGATDAGPLDLGPTDTGPNDGGPSDTGVLPPVTCMEAGLSPRVYRDSASSGTPDTYLINVQAGDPFCARITGGGSGTWSVVVSNGTSSGIYCQGTADCRARVRTGDTVLFVTAVTTNIGSYTLTVDRIPRP